MIRTEWCTLLQGTVRVPCQGLHRVFQQRFCVRRALSQQTLVRLRQVHRDVSVRALAAAAFGGATRLAVQSHVTVARHGETPSGGFCLFDTERWRVCSLNAWWKSVLCDFGRARSEKGT